MWARWQRRENGKRLRKGKGKNECHNFRVRGGGGGCCEKWLWYARTEWSCNEHFRDDGKLETSRQISDSSKVSDPCRLHADLLRAGWNLIIAVPNIRLKLRFSPTHTHTQNTPAMAKYLFSYLIMKKKPEKGGERAWNGSEWVRANIFFAPAIFPFFFIMYGANAIMANAIWIKFKFMVWTHFLLLFLRPSSCFRRLRYIKSNKEAGKKGSRISGEEALMTQIPLPNALRFSR